MVNEFKFEIKLIFFFFLKKDLVCDMDGLGMWSPHGVESYRTPSPLSVLERKRESIVCCQL